MALTVSIGGPTRAISSVFCFRLCYVTSGNKWPNFHLYVKYGYLINYVAKFQSISFLNEICYRQINFVPINLPNPLSTLECFSFASPFAFLHAHCASMAAVHSSANLPANIGKDPLLCFLHDRKKLMPAGLMPFMADLSVTDP